VHINDLLKAATDRGASDLHLKVGSHPVVRVDGRLMPLTAEKRLMQEDTIAMAFSIMSARQKQKFKDNFEIDMAYSVPGLGRFRCSVFQQRGTVGLVLRVIPVRILTIKELLLPPVMEVIASERRGLILVTGTTGSGKSTSLAAMIDYINSTRTEHIMTIEDPIEFLHRDKKSLVNQREVEVDTKTFSFALRSALRQDPDVILVGEMRDYETIETALHAGETGHLVLSTLHTLDATETVNRIISVFPPTSRSRSACSSPPCSSPSSPCAWCPAPTARAACPRWRCCAPPPTSGTAWRTRRRPSSSGTPSPPAPPSTACRPSTSRCSGSTSRS
jgi:twitching motility protein PilT